MAEKGGATTRVQPAHPNLAATRIEPVRRTEPVGRTERTSLGRRTTQAISPVSGQSAANRLTAAMQKMVEDLEKGQGALDKLINGSLRGKAFSQTDLLALQASMYKYSQELDLTGKVVEKATNGLKDTLKTQV
jgi:hypothetical protein